VETIAGLDDDDGRLPEQEPECREGGLEAHWIGRPLNTDRELMARMARGGVRAPREKLVSAKATMLREMGEAFTDLRAVLREMDDAGQRDSA
jgi:hypothetical protein